MTVGDQPQIEDGLMLAIRMGGATQKILVAALRASEWCEVFPEAEVGDFICGACGNERTRGHGFGCEVKDALSLWEEVDNV